MNTVKLVDLAKTIRSKNAGTDRITFDIIFRRRRTTTSSARAARSRARP